MQLFFADNCVINLRLKEERERLGLSQPVFAKAAGSAKRTLIDWEKGVTSPTAIQLVALSAIGTDVPYILTGERTSADALRAHTHAAQFTLRQDLDESLVQTLAESWQAQGEESIAAREKEDALLLLFRKMSDQSKTSLLAVAQSLATL